MIGNKEGKPKSKPRQRFEQGRLECSFARVVGLPMLGGRNCGKCGIPARVWLNSPMAVMKVSVILQGQDDHHADQ